MVCSNCGKEIPEGLDYCEACGAPANEPITISSAAIKASSKAASKPASKVASDDEVYGNSFFNFPNYVSAVMCQSYRAIALASGLMLYLSMFFGFIWIKNGVETSKPNVFNLASKNGKYALDSKKLFICAIIMLVMGVLMLIYSARDYIKPVRKFANKKLLWFGVWVISLADFLVIYTDDGFKSVVARFKDDVAFSNSFAGGIKCSWGYGIGFFLAIAAIVLYLFAVFMGVFDVNEQKQQWV